MARKKTETTTSDGRRLVNKAEYARSRGMSRQAVYTAVKDGRIAGAVTEDGMIDVLEADRLWAKNTDPLVGHHGKLKNIAKMPATDMLDAARSVGVDVGKPPDMYDSKTLEAAYKAQLARIEYEQKSGTLVESAEVEKQAFRLARLTRDAMLSIPDRISAELSGMTDAFEIHQRLSAEIRQAIAELKAMAEAE